jgi:hypothetical protein
MREGGPALLRDETRLPGKAPLAHKTIDNIVALTLPRQRTLPPLDGAGQVTDSRQTTPRRIRGSCRKTVG